MKRIILLTIIFLLIGVVLFGLNLENHLSFYSSKPNITFEIISTPSLAPTKESPINSFVTPTNSLNEGIYSTDKDLSGNQNKLPIDKTDSIINLANVIVQWSALILAAFSFILLIVGFFGISEYKKILNQYKDAENLKIRLESLISSIEGVKDDFNEQLKRMKLNFEKESQSFMRDSYNYNEAIRFYKKGDYLQAIEYFSKVNESQPLNKEIYYKLGRANTHLGDTQNAVENFQEALKIDENYADAFRGLAICYRYSEPEKALDFIKSAVEKDPKNCDSYDYWGLLLRDAMKIEEAIKKHELSEKLGGNPETAFYLALLYAYQKKIDRAKIMINLACYKVMERQVQNRIRPLWPILYKWAKLTFEDNNEEAFVIIKETKDYVTTWRVAQGVLGHIKFLLTSLDKIEFIDQYEEFYQYTIN